MIIKYNNHLVIKISRIRYDCIFNNWHFSKKSVEIFYVGFNGCDINVYYKNTKSKLFSISYSQNEDLLRITDFNLLLYEPFNNDLTGFNDFKNTIKSSLFKC